MDFVQDWVRQSATVLSVSKNCIGAGKHLRLCKLSMRFAIRTKENGNLLHFALGNLYLSPEEKSSNASKRGWSAIY